MYQAAGLIWSGVAPKEINQYDAEKYCQGLGGGARLPTKEEWAALVKIMSPGGMYNPNFLPDMRGKWFWSSSVGPLNADFAFAFYGPNGCVDINIRSYSNWVRCVIGGSTTQEQQAIPSSSNSVSSSSQELGANSHSIVQVVPSDPRVSHAFTALGAVHEAAGLIWSAVAPKKMNQYDAEKYCQGLGARLPTKEDWEALGKIPGPGGKSNFNSDLILPGTKKRWFWSSSSSPPFASSALRFNGYDGSLNGKDRRINGWVRCVATLTAVLTSSSPVDGSIQKLS